MISDFSLQQYPEYRLPLKLRFVLQNLLRYDRQAIHKFLEEATINNDHAKLTDEERLYLSEMWTKMINPFFSDRINNIQLIDIKLYGVRVKVVTVYCAISCVFSIVMNTPKLLRRRIDHNCQLGMAAVLAVICKLGVPDTRRPQVSMVCAMYGYARGSGSRILVFGTAKCHRLSGHHKTKLDMSKEKWRLERVEKLNMALLGAGGGREASESWPEYKYHPGDCAETIPMMVIAEVCEGEVGAIAIRPKDIPKAYDELAQWTHGWRKCCAPGDK